MEDFLSAEPKHPAFIHQQPGDVLSMMGAPRVMTRSGPHENKCQALERRPFGEFMVRVKTSRDVA